VAWSRRRWWYPPYPVAIVVNTYVRRDAFLSLSWSLKWNIKNVFKSFFRLMFNVAERSVAALSPDLASGSRSGLQRRPYDWVDQRVCLWRCSWIDHPEGWLSMRSRLCTTIQVWREKLFFYLFIHFANREQILFLNNSVATVRYGNSRTSRTFHFRTKNFPYIPVPSIPAPKISRTIPNQQIP
jgi:hypothetical protein